jgi:hypothetical protein
VEELRSRRPGGGPSTAGAEGAATVQRQRGTTSGHEELGEAAGDLPREERPVWAHTGVARGAARNAARVVAVLRAGVAQVGVERDGPEPLVRQPERRGRVGKDHPLPSTQARP